MYLGASNEYSAGFAGVMRGVVLNGEQKSLDKEVQTMKMKGVQSGVKGRCYQNPCFNGGFCLEHYDSYSCDCLSTPFHGAECLEGIAF